MKSKLLVAGVVITGVGLASLGYLDPVLRIHFFGATGGAGGAAFFTRIGSAAATFTGGFPASAGRDAAGGTTSLVTLAAIVVFAVTVIGLLLTIAGSFSLGERIPAAGSQAPAAADSK